MADPCPQCGADRLLIGYRHRCVPKGSQTPPGKNPAVKDVREVGRRVEPPTRGAAAPIKLKRGRPLAKDKDKTLAAAKPWLNEGMSRTTWFRRQREKRK